MSFSTVSMCCQHDIVDLIPPNKVRMIDHHSAGFFVTVAVIDSTSPQVYNPEAGTANISVTTTEFRDLVKMLRDVTKDVVITLELEIDGVTIHNKCFKTTDRTTLLSLSNQMTMTDQHVVAVQGKLNLEFAAVHHQLRTIRDLLGSQEPGEEELNQTGVHRRIDQAVGAKPK